MAEIMNESFEINLPADSIPEAQKKAFIGPNSIVPGTLRIDQVKDNCWVIKRDPPRPEVNIWDLVQDKSAEVCVKYSVIQGDQEDPLLTISVEYKIEKSGENSSMVNRRCFDFVQFKALERDLLPQCQKSFSAENECLKLQT